MADSRVSKAESRLLQNSLSKEENVLLLKNSLSKEENVLLSEIGENYCLAAAPRTFNEYIADGKAWLQDHLDDLRLKICGNIMIRDLVGKELFPLALAIWITLAEHFDQSKSLATVAALLAKYDLNALCADVWDRREG